MADNIIDFNSRKSGGPGNGGSGVGPGAPPPPNFPPPEGLPQDDYIFYLVDKITGEEMILERTGHLVVTQSNIVLFNKEQEMIFGIPNDSSLMYFERVSPKTTQLEIPFGLYEDEQ